MESITLTTGSDCYARVFDGYGIVWQPAPTPSASPLHIPGGSMTSRIALSFVALVALVLAGCGNSKLTSVTVTPATADAQNFPNGQVQFTAMGTFSDSSKPVPLTTVTWCVGSSNGMCNGNIASPAIIESNGLARCSAVLNGTATVLAGTGNSMMGMPDTGEQLRVFGTAKLTCP